MPNLANPRHELFVQNLSKGLSAKESYLTAGYPVKRKSADEAASRLSRNVKVKARLAELQAHHAETTEVIVSSLVAELDAMRDAALALRQISAGIAAIMGKAKLLGFLNDRPPDSEKVPKPAPIPTEAVELTEEEWVAMFKPKRMHESYKFTGKGGNNAD